MEEKQRKEVKELANKKRYTTNNGWIEIEEDPFSFEEYNYTNNFEQLKKQNFRPLREKLKKILKERKRKFPKEEEEEEEIPETKPPLLLEKVFHIGKKRYVPLLMREVPPSRKKKGEK